MERYPTSKRPPVTLSGLTGNRDWFITISCETDAVLLRPTGQRFTLADLTAKTKGEHPLAQAVRQLVARAARQPCGPEKRRIDRCCNCRSRRGRWEPTT